MRFGWVFYEYSILMYSDVFQMYPRARVGKPSDTIKIQHADVRIIDSMAFPFLPDSLRDIHITVGYLEL